MSDWISVEDRLPPPHHHFLALNRNGYHFESCMCYGMHEPWFTYPRGDGHASNTAPDWIDVTHWMPLPGGPDQTRRAESEQDAGPDHIPYCPPVGEGQESILEYKRKHCGLTDCPSPAIDVVCPVCETDKHDYKALYYELIMEVGNKWPGETRHETARRYIHEREQEPECSHEWEEGIGERVGTVWVCHKCEAFTLCRTTGEGQSDAKT